MRAMLSGFCCLIVGIPLCGAITMQSQMQKASLYPTMAPVSRYLMEAEAETVLARSAAPKSISNDAQVMVLWKTGFHVTAKGKNGWTCLVERSWNAAVDFPEFWNPNIGAPICLNAAAVRTVLPVVLFWTGMVLKGESRQQMAHDADAAFVANRFPTLQPGSMSLMMSRDQYLTDENPRFHPHVMFFEPLGEGSNWGANLPGSPIFVGDDKVNRIAILPIPVPRWSDATLDAHPED